MIFRFFSELEKVIEKSRQMMPTGSQNGARMSYFSHFCPQKSMKNPSRFSDVEKGAPGTKKYEMFIPSDPQNHQKTIGKHRFSWKSPFSLPATLRTEKAPKITPKWAQHGSKNGKKTVKIMKKSMQKSMTISASFFLPCWLHLGSIFEPKME